MTAPAGAAPRRIAEARFPRIKRLADFNTDHIPGIAATVLERPANMGYLPGCRSIVAMATERPARRNPASAADPDG
jgi:hypothetical protein